MLCKLVCPTFAFHSTLYLRLCSTALGEATRAVRIITDKISILTFLSHNNQARCDWGERHIVTDDILNPEGPLLEDGFIATLGYFPWMSYVTELNRTHVARLGSLDDGVVLRRPTI